MGCGASTASPPKPDPAGTAYALSEANVAAADEANADAVATGTGPPDRLREPSVSEMSTVGALPDLRSASTENSATTGGGDAFGELPQAGMFKTKTIDANGKVIQIQSPVKSKKYVNPIVARKTSASIGHLEKQLKDFKQFNASGACAITKNSSAPSLSTSVAEEDEEDVEETTKRRGSITGAGPLSLGANVPDEPANLGASLGAAPALVEGDEEEEF